MSNYILWVSPEEIGALKIFASGLCSIFLTIYLQVARQLQIFRGSIPLLYETPRPEGAWMDDVDARVESAISFGKKSGFIQAGGHVVVITGWRQGAGSSNTVRILPVN